jgi:hypothetical protein
MVHNLLIAVHTLTGVVCFGAGVACLGLTTAGSIRFRVYFLTLLGLLVSLLAAVLVDWSGLDHTTQLVYTGLSGLGIYMLWRAVRASARLREQAPGWRPGYQDDVGFTLISLFDGFVIVGAIDLGAPGWLVAVIAVAGVAIGILAIRQVKARSARSPEA